MGSVPSHSAHVCEILDRLTKKLDFSSATSVKKPKSSMVSKNAYPLARRGEFARELVTQFFVVGLLPVVVPRHRTDLVETGLVVVVEITQIAKDTRPVGVVLYQLDLDGTGLRHADVNVHRRFATAVAADIADPRHDVERPDTEDIDPATCGTQQVVDYEAELEHPVFALGPWLLEQLVRGRLRNWHERGPPGGAGDEVSVDVVDGAAHQSSVTRDRHQFRGVAVPWSNRTGRCSHRE